MQIRQMIKNVLAIFITMSMLVMPAYANGDDFNADVVLEETPVVAVASETDESSIRATPRGMLLSTCALQISDEGKGIIGVYAETLCHYPMSRIRIRIYLDALASGSDEEDWYTVDMYDYDWLASDYPDVTLNSASVSFDITGMPRKTEYRLRGVHMAYDSDGSLSEMMNTKTAWISLR